MSADAGTGTDTDVHTDSDADTPPAAAATPTAMSVAREIVRSLDRFRTGVWLIIVAQAIWLGVLMGHGWYYQADFANLAQATGRPLSWSYLSGPQGGHFAVLGRFLFWILNRTAPLNYPLTIALRLAAQALATGLLARFLVLLVGRRPTVLVALTLYAFSPLLLQGTLWLSASFGLIGSQLMLLGAFTFHVRYAVTRRLGYAVATAAFVLGATLLSEQASVTSLVLPLLSLFFLTSGRAKDRLRGMVALWREWLLIAVPMVGYVLYYFSGAGGYGVAARPLTAADAVRVVRVEIAHTIVPGLVGGPWRWFAAGDNYLGLSSPASQTQALAALALLVVIGYCFRKQGWRAVGAWSMPLVVAAAGIVVVAVGRYRLFGLAIAEQFEHGYYAAFPAAMAVCLAVCGLDLDAVRARVERSVTARSAPLGAMTWRWRLSVRQALVTCGVIALMVSSLISGVTYAQLWGRNPSRTYVTTIEHELRRAGRHVALYDSPVPSRFIPLESRASRYVSSLVALTGVPADFGYAARDPHLLDATGHVTAAGFLPTASVDLTGDAFCKFPVQRVVTVTRSFAPAPRRNDWYVLLVYFQQHASVVQITVVDRDGTERSPVNGGPELLHAGVGGIHLLFFDTAPVSIRVRSTGPATNLCVAAVQVGVPVALARKAGR